MPIPETKDGVLKELHSWQNIISSDEWVVFRNLLKDHIAYLQKETNDLLRKKEFTDAFGSLRAMDDSSKILTLVTTRLNELNRKGEK